MTKARILSFLMVVCLATTCMLSGTIAKYTTNDSNNDDAIVGKWGVILGIDGTLFGNNYLGATGLATDATDDTVSVKSQSASKLVAPGTKSDKGMTITLTGNPEVDTKILVTASSSDVYLAAGTYAVLIPVNAASVTAENFVANKYYTIGTGNVLDVFDGSVEATEGYTAFAAAAAADTAIYVIDNVKAEVGTGGYYPVVYKLDYNNTIFTTTDDVTGKASDIVSALLSYNNNTNEPFTTSTDFGTTCALNGANISWKWDFEFDNTEAQLEEEELATAQANKDAMDSILGALIAGQKVVSITGTPGAEVYTVLVADDADAYSIEAAGTEVAYLKTVLDFSITVEQVD